MGKLDGKVAAITGGTRSIGRGIADAFVREGASVVVNGRDEAKGQVCLDEMGAGERAAFFAGDASKQEAVEGLVDFAIDRYGQLDIMVLNSGGVNMTAPVAQMTDEEWKFEIDWNLNHVFWGMRRALQHMIPRESGRILVTSSVEGKLGKPGIPGYVTTKHAVNGLVKAAAQEVGTLGITVNALLPGIIETDIVRATGPDSAVAMGVGTYDKMIELFTEESAIKRPNTAEEVAAVAVMLASDARPQHHRLPVPDRRRHDALLMASEMVLIAGWIDVDPACARRARRRQRPAPALDPRRRAGLPVVRVRRRPGRRRPDPRLRAVGDRRRPRRPLRPSQLPRHEGAAARLSPGRQRDDEVPGRRLRSGLRARRVAVGHLLARLSPAS